MYNSGKIIIGIIIFAAVFSSPFWINFAGAESAKGPEIKYVVDTAAVDCLADKEYMRANHMDMLNEWRDLVVRSNERYLKDNKGNIVVINGQPVEMSLSLTCLNCHSNKETFCDGCHNYMDVAPYCWDCHVAPKAKTPPEPIKEEIQ
jgi:hypothetical protein